MSREYKQTNLRSIPDAIITPNRFWITNYYLQLKKLYTHRCHGSRFGPLQRGWMGDALQWCSVCCGWLPWLLQWLVEAMPTQSLMMMIRRLSGCEAVWSKWAQEEGYTAMGIWRVNFKIVKQSLTCFILLFVTPWAQYHGSAYRKHRIGAYGSRECCAYPKRISRVSS